MKNNKQNTGIGNYQTDKAAEARWLILKTLSDGQWHRNMELKEKTRLSSRTLAKHLNHMTDIQTIERKTDVESGKYPVPVFYKATPQLIVYIKATLSREEITKGIKETLDETKDPLMVLELIHASSQVYLIFILTQIQQNKNITNEQINFLAECFLWANYKQWTSKLIDESQKVINNFNFTQLLINQAQRQKTISEELIKRYEQQTSMVNEHATDTKET